MHVYLEVCTTMFTGTFYKVSVQKIEYGQVSENQIGYLRFQQEPAELAKTYEAHSQYSQYEIFVFAISHMKH